jgi:hypothetical protein
MHTSKNTKKGDNPVHVAPACTGSGGRVRLLLKIQNKDINYLECDGGDFGDQTDLSFL